MKPQVDTLIGGVQKGGTTSLFAYMSAHPSFLPFAGKEAHFFDDESVDWSRPDYRRYHDMFGPADDPRLRVEATPIYLFWPPALERIRAYNPHMRLIFIFRDPIERAWSHWCMEYARGADDLPFAEAIRGGRARLDGLPDLDPARRVYTYVERGFYAQQVARLLDLFPRRQLLFLRSDDLRDEPAQCLAQIATFLEAAPFPRMPAERRNERPAVAYPSVLSEADIAYLRDLFIEDVRGFSALTGLPVRTWLTMRG